MADQTDEECCSDPQCGSCDTCREHCQCWHDDDVWHRA